MSAGSAPENCRLRIIAGELSALQIHASDPRTQSLPESLPETSLETKENSLCAQKDFGSDLQWQIHGRNSLAGSQLVSCLKEEGASFY